MPPLIVILVYRSCLLLLLLLGGGIVWYVYSVLPWKAVYWLVDNGGIHIHPVYCRCTGPNSLRAAGGEFKFHS